jgi:hypothetical protein
MNSSEEKLDDTLAEELKVGEWSFWEHYEQVEEQRKTQHNVEEFKNVS